MSSLSPTQRKTLARLLVGWIAVVVGSWVAVPKLVLDGYDGKSFGAINRKIDEKKRNFRASGADPSREWFAAWARGYALKATLLATLLAGAGAVMVASRRAQLRVYRFLFAPSAAFNLAVLRIVVFGMLFYLLWTEPIREFAAWSRENYVWPWVSGPLFERLPINVEMVDWLMPVALVATLFALLGGFTRTSAWVSCLLAIYLLGIPQCSGKVNHTMHHVVLIGLLIACSRAGDSLSLDSFWQAIWRADRGRVARVNRSVRYGLPIRLSMLVLASCYFFPGFWKIATNGPGWIFSDNLHNQLLHKWFEIERYTPPLALYEVPGFTTMGALTSVVFELLFPLALLWRPTRVLWAALGLLFHNMTRVLMNISFMTLQAMYVMFVDWQRLLFWWGRRMYNGPLVVLYDGNCKLCRRSASVLAVIDWLGAIKPISAFDRERFSALGLGHLDDVALMTDMHAARKLDSGEWFVTKGYSSYQQIAWRIPLLWPVLPIVYLPPVVKIGSGIYRRVADSRACNVPTKSADGNVQSTAVRWSAIPLLAMAILILAAQVQLGMLRLRKSWPVACYPLFDEMKTASIYWPEFEVRYADGSTQVLDDDALRDHFTESRYVPPMKRFVATPVDEQELKNLLRDFVQVWRDAGALGTSPPERIAVYIAKYDLTGPQRPAKPTLRDELIEFPWQDVSD